MVYAIIRQLINLLPTGAPSLPDETILKSLDGTLRTWKNAIEVLGHVAKQVRLPMLLFVVDGINVLEDDFGRATDPALTDFITLITSLRRPEVMGSERVVKILWTTSGMSETLGRLVDDRETVSCSSSSPGSFKGRSSRQYFYL